MLERLCTQEDLAAANAAARACIFVTVDWSIYERNSRKQFFLFCDWIWVHYPDLGIKFYAIGEDCDDLGRWFEERGLPHLNVMGTGSVIWMEKGRVAGHELDANSPGDRGLAERTLAFWKKEPDA